MDRSARLLFAALFSCAWFVVLPGSAHAPLDEQIATLTARIQHDSQNPMLYLRRGELHGDWEAALADYERAAQLDPNLAAVDLARGKTLLQSGRFGPAKIALDRFLAKYPGHGKALATHARVLVKLGQCLAAAEDYTRAISAKENLAQPNPEYYLERARALAAEGGEYIDEALRGLDEGIEKLGPLAALQLEAINLELARKQYDAAVARLESIAAQSTRKELWLARRGEILEQAGRVEEARLAYQQALSALESLLPRHRKTRATAQVETQVFGALARLAGNEPKETDP